MRITAQLINRVFLVLSACLLLFCLYELIFASKIYPFAFLGIMSLLGFSSFLSNEFTLSKFSLRTRSILLFFAVVNFLLLVSFSFYPVLLRMLWTVSFGLVYIYPITFILSFVKSKESKLEKVLYYFSIITLIIFETTLLFKLSQDLIYRILTAFFIVLSLLLLTYTISKFRKGFFNTRS